LIDIRPIPPQKDDDQKRGLFGDESELSIAYALVTTIFNDKAYSMLPLSKDNIWQKALYPS